MDAQGIPIGEIAVKAENWRDMIAMANAAGALPDQAVDPVTRALNFMAGLGGNPNALDLQLNFRDGFCRFGAVAPWSRAPFDPTLTAVRALAMSGRVQMKVIPVIAV